MSDNLTSLSPDEGVELYLDDRVNELSDATHQSHGYRLDRFLEWCEQESVDNLNDLTGRSIHEFRTWRRKQDVSPWTLKSQMDTLRVFIRFCERIDGVIGGLADSIDSPSVATQGNRGTDVVSRDKAERILAHLNKFDYASIQHVLTRLLWETGARMGAIRSIDLEHYRPREQFVELRHQPESDTPLKNKLKGERDVALSPTTCIVIDDYIEHHRFDIKDSHGRSALLTTRHGRITKNTLRNYIYRVTRPCTYTECPHDRDPSECDGMDNQTPYLCPSSSAPHSFRHGAITDFLDRDTEARVVSERCNVTMAVLDQHYNHLTNREKMEIRRGNIDFVD